ncbi:MAG TPA: nuclear transport factor 2 family protein [Solirubrobacterales bacterium]|nr:nuclear transport factor 2 family protein [Solirubrobacterales bacterium]
MSRHADEATVRRWFDAFNSRDLEGMLTCMHANVDFRPLRLQGIDSLYHCHVGVRIWFEDLTRMEHPHRIELSAVRTSGAERVVATGALADSDVAGPSSFWAMKHLENGVIISAHHHLSDRLHLR